MPTIPASAQPTLPNPIQVATAFSLLPVHRLSRGGEVAISVRERDGRGRECLRWEVIADRRHGQPGPLAYRIDTLVVARRIAEAARPLPQFIRLGTLHSICQELGASSGGAMRAHVKAALDQNAGILIDAKVSYLAADGTERLLEGRFHRYSITSTGEKLPDGRIANGIYLVFNERYKRALDAAATRPLDFDYLKSLTPVSQRLYEILGPRIEAAARDGGRGVARLAYSEFCASAPQVRYADYERLKKQMFKIHDPHRKAGYIEGVRYEATLDREERPDWLMVYTPGPRARRERDTFAGKKKGRPAPCPETATAPPRPAPIARGVPPAPAVEPAPNAGEGPDEGEGRTTPRPEAATIPSGPPPIAQGVPPAPVAGPAPDVERLIRIFEEYDERDRRRASAGGAGSQDAHDPIAILGAAFCVAYARRESLKTPAESELARREREAAKVAEFLALVAGREPERFDADALKGADPERREHYERAVAASARWFFQVFIREPYARRFLGLPPAE